jgi:hypothetical protein
MLQVKAVLGSISGKKKAAVCRVMGALHRFHPILYLLIYETQYCAISTLQVKAVFGSGKQKVAGCL